MTFEIGSLSFKVQSFRALGVWVQAQGSDDRSPTRHVKVLWAGVLSQGFGFRVSAEVQSSALLGFTTLNCGVYGVSNKR